MAETDEGGQATTRPAGGSANSSNPFLRKLGPLPMWVWMLLGLAVALIIAFWRKDKAAASTTASNQAAAAAGAAEAAQTPPFIIQNYTGSGNTTPRSGHPATHTSTPPTPLPTYTVTGNGDDNINGLIKTLYHVPAADTTEYSIIAQAILAANPDRTGWGAHIPAGTVINLPANYQVGGTVL